MSKTMHNGLGHVRFERDNMGKAMQNILGHGRGMNEMT